MNHDLRRTLRDATARTLLAASRVLARLAARTVGHPSARQKRVVQRPELRVVRNVTFRTQDIDPVVLDLFYGRHPDSHLGPEHRDAR